MDKKTLRPHILPGGQAGKEKRPQSILKEETLSLQDCLWLQLQSGITDREHWVGIGGMSVFLKIGIIFICMVFCLSVHVCTPFVPGACGVPGGCETLCGCWELNAGSPHSS